MARKPSCQTGTPGPRVKQTPMIDAGRMVMSNGELRYVRTSISYLYIFRTATIVMRMTNVIVVVVVVWIAVVVVIFESELTEMVLKARVLI